MRFNNLIPQVFYANAQDGIDLWVHCLGFNVVYQDVDSPNPFFVLEHEDIKLYLVEDAEFAAKDRPQFRIETADINSIYNHVRIAYPQFLHPNMNQPTLREWNATELALLDASGVCVVFMQWS